ncbi:MAG: GH92 family glycosyl hydrolase, partial [Rikenellaceae bacterium]
MFNSLRSTRTRLLIFSCALLCSCAQPRASLSDYVDPFIGTDAHGHTYPGATTPFGLVQLSPDTGTEGWDWCSGYHSSDNSIMGFSHSHLSGTGGADLGDILFMPSSGQVRFTAGTKENPKSGYRSTFSHSSERASAGYYKVFLDEPSVTAELTATSRVGVHRYRYDNPQGQHIIVDLNHGIQDKATRGAVRLVGDSVVEGFRRSKGWADDHTVFFYAHFDAPIASMEVSKDGAIEKGVSDAWATSLVAALLFEKPQHEINIQVGISYVSVEGAKKNLEAQTAGKSFDQIHAQTRELWNNELSKVKVTGSEDDKVIFYTALYHSMLAPYGMSDVDGCYIGSDRQIRTDTLNTNYGLFSLWDTFRALHPLMTIVNPQKNQEFIHSMLRYYTQRGALPVWDLNMRENYCMIGYHSVPVIVDAYMKGQRDFDAQLALEAMVHSAMQEDYAGVEHYREFGYLPSNKENNAVSKALEYAYDDWCIAQMAKEMGQDSLYEVFVQRAQYYKNHFDPTDGFMKGRDSYGQLRSPFDPTEISALGKGDFTEGSSWQYTFFVPQDVSGLIELMGGDQKFVEKIEELFNSQIGTTSHADVSGLIGNYAQGNEPGHHIPYLYNYAGEPWRTQQRIAQIKQQFFTSSRDGLCGNEDCGQMSAWYVFSAMGFYPVTPASPIYALGTPTFEKVTIELGNSKQFTIEAPNAGKDNIYIQKVEWNGQPYTKSYITHDMIEEGGTLTLRMGSIPNKTFGTAVEDRPSSAIVDHQQTSQELLSRVVFEPYIQNPQRVFQDVITVTPAQHN